MSLVNNEKDTIKISRMRKRLHEKVKFYNIKTLKYGIIWGSMKRDLTFDGLNDFFGKV